MKKLLITFITILLSISFFNVYAEEPSLDINLESKNAYVIDTTNRQILLDKGSEERIYPASMTKIMTAIVALETLDNLDEHITITEEMVDGLLEADASMAGFWIDDTPTVKELLYGVALPSGADACNALAYRISGGINAYVDLMNKKALEIGMNNTNFVNTTGLHDDNHYSTCRDIATLLEYCIKNETFKEIFSSTTYRTSPTIYYPEGIEFHSTFKYFLEEYDVNIPGLIGGKTGYTIPAGHSMASWSSLNDMDIITVVAQGSEDMYNSTHIYDTKSIMDTLNNWHKETLLTKDELLKEITVTHQYTKDTFTIVSSDDIILDIPNDATVVKELDIIDNFDSDLSSHTLSYPFTIKVDDNVVYEKYINLTIPKEKSFFGRIIKRVKRLFS